MTSLAGVAFEPMPVEVFGDPPELDDEVSGQVLGLGFAALLPPQPEQGAFIGAHDDPGVRAADKGASRRVICHAAILSHMTSKLSCE